MLFFWIVAYPIFAFFHQREDALFDFSGGRYTE